jgi:homoserine dehydrogenase
VPTQCILDRNTQERTQDMVERDLIIMKFGGSVLVNRDSLDLVVDECYNAVHAGHKVIVVISAYNGMTDLLQTEAGRHMPANDFGAFTGLLSLGEVLTSAETGLALLDAGLDAHVVNVGEIGLRANGDPLDADLIGVDTRSIHDLLLQHQVLVVPGYMSVDTKNRILLLGRGGSDLTATYLAGALGARTCSLIKDVDGLYERELNQGRRFARRYQYLNYADAVALGPQVIQPKALAVAEQYELNIEVRSTPHAGCTIVGAGPSVLEVDPAAEQTSERTD